MKDEKTIEENSRTIGGIFFEHYKTRAIINWLEDFKYELSKDAVKEFANDSHEFLSDETIKKLSLYKYVYEKIKKKREELLEHNDGEIKYEDSILFKDYIRKFDLNDN